MGTIEDWQSECGRYRLGQTPDGKYFFEYNEVVSGHENIWKTNRIYFSKGDISGAVAFLVDKGLLSYD